MKKLLMILSVVFFSIMIAVPAFPLSYEFDLNGDAVWDNDDFVFIGQSVPVEIWLDNYSCPPDDKLIGVQLYVIL